MDQLSYAALVTQYIRDTKPQAQKMYIADGYYSADTLSLPSLICSVVGTYVYANK